MSRRLRNLSASLTIAAAAMAIGACGGSDDPAGEKLPSAAAEELRRQLTSVGARVESRSGGACDDIFDPDPDVGNLGPIDETMAEIPGDVDPEVRAALEQSIDRLKELVDSECEEIVTDERERSQEEDLAPEEEIPTPPTTEEPVTTEPTITEPEPDDKPEKPKDEEGDEEKSGRGPDGEGPPGQGGGGVDAPTEEGDE